MTDAMTCSLPLLRSLRFERLSVLGPTGEPVLECASADLPTDRTVWVRASNGGGKSQFLRLLAGLDEPSEGAYLINGRNVTEMDFSEFTPFLKRIGFGFEYGGLISNRTIEENLRLPFQYHQDLPEAEASARVEETLRRFGLDRVRNRRPAACSGGNRKVACVARSLITWPELLLLDHPTAGLDERGVHTLQELIELHRRERGLRHVYIASEDERFLSGLSGVEKLDLSTFGNPLRKAA